MWIERAMVIYETNLLGKYCHRMVLFCKRLWGTLPVTVWGNDGTQQNKTQPTKKSNPPAMSWNSPLLSTGNENESAVTSSDDVIARILFFSWCNCRNRGISFQLLSMSTMNWDELRMRQNFSVMGKACSWKEVSHNKTDFAFNFFQHCLSKEN